MDDIFKALTAVMTMVLGWCWVGVQRNNNRHETHSNKLGEHDTKLHVIDEQMKHILDKLNDVVELGVDLKRSNNTILRALARNSKKD